MKFVRDLIVVVAAYELIQLVTERSELTLGNLPGRLERWLFHRNGKPASSSVEDDAPIHPR